ncbi:MAG: Crp/Fnr family transcriptional regulator [Ramlibacter sp.]
MAGLGAADLALLEKRCTLIELQAGKVLSHPGEPGRHVYFLAAATVASVVHCHGASLALGLAGRHGAAGLHLALGLGVGNFTLLVQTAGTAWRADGDALHRLALRRPALLLAFSRHLWAAAEQVAALAARAQGQDIKARLADWILLSAQQGHVGDLRLTHEHLAAMLGVRRASVTLAAAELRAARLLD